MKKETIETIKFLNGFSEEEKKKVLEEAQHYYEVNGYANNMKKQPTDAENKFAKILDDNGIQYIQQAVIETKDNHYYIVDFLLNNKVVIEIDGGYHNEEEQKERDEYRTKVLESLGYGIFRITNEEVETYYRIQDEIIDWLRWNAAVDFCKSKELYEEELEKMFFKLILDKKLTYAYKVIDKNVSTEIQP